MNKRNIVWQFSIFILLIIAGVSWHINNQKNELVLSLALDNAMRVNLILNEVRVLYTEQIIPTALQFNIPVTQGIHLNQIPLPASFSKILSARINKKLDHASSRLYSPYPFPSNEKSGGLKDKFSKDAWNALQQTPAQAYYQFQLLRSGLTLRYATADILQKQCVNCHNSHPDSPKKDWKTGDVRGVLETSIPLNENSDLITEQLKYSTLFLFVFISFVVIGVAYFIRKIIISEVYLSKQLKNKIKKLQSEKIKLLRLHHIVSNSNDLVAFMDLNYIYKVVNQRYLDVFKIQENDIVNRHVNDIVGSEAFEKIIKPKIDKAYEGEVVTWQTWMTTPTGKYFFNVAYKPLIDKSNNITGITATIQDMTELHKVEEALRRSQKMDAIGQLTGGIAHDFNNILGIILGNLDLLEVQVSSDKNAISRIRAIEKSAQRAADLTKQLLGFSRLQPNKLDLININEIIISMEDLIARSITPKIEIITELSKNLPLTKIDRGDFEDALINLIINARDAMADGGTLQIKTREMRFDKIYCEANPETAVGDYIELSIVDNGIGITPSQLEHIFEPFFTTKEIGKGTGLGLSMVFGFMQRSKGFIKALSEENSGTQFILTFPVSTEVSTIKMPHNNT